MVRNAVLLFALLALSLGFTPKLHAAAANPALAQKWVTYAQQLYAARQYDKALQAFSTAARADSRNAAAWKGLGNCLYAKKDYANALKYYKFSYQLNPADTQLAAFIPRLAAAAARPATTGETDLANRYLAARRYDEAIQHYNAALATNPNDARAWQGMGTAYAYKQDKPKAVEAFKKSLQLNPRNTSLANYLARYSPESAQAAGVNVAYGPKDWVQPLWRSAVLPGWGQFYNGERTKGWILGTLNVVMLGGTVGTWVIGNSARDKYIGLPAGSKQADFDAAYSSWDSMASMNHIFNIAWAASYTYTLVDAVMNAKARPLGQAMFEEKAPALEFSALPGGGVGAQYRLMEF